jgi:ATP-binding cassette subfamily C (CFTR/MRP) protein 2
VCFKQTYYIAAAKEVMRMNGTTKSYVANHVAETVAGAVTIRAFEEEDRFFEKNLDLIDINASAFFHNFASNEWLILRLETISAALLASAALCMVILPPGTFSSGENLVIFFYPKKNGINSPLNITKFQYLSF